MRRRRLLAVTLLTAGLLSPSAAWAGPNGDPICGIHSSDSYCADKDYRVQRGDWLWKIARKNLAAHNFGTKDSRVVKRHADAIYAKNRAVIGSNPSRLRAGMRLVLPSPAAL